MNCKTNNGLVVIPDRAMGERLPDTDRYKYRFKVNSSSSDRVYLISYDSAPGAGYWTCSCRGNIGHGHCQHLDSLNLPTRRDATQRKLGAQETHQHGRGPGR